MYEKKLKLIDLAYNQLTDEESRRWFNVRWNYLLSGDGVSLLEDIHSCFDEFYPGIEDFCGGDVAKLSDAVYGDRPIFVFGTGTIGHHTYWTLKHSVLKKRIAGFVNSRGTTENGENAIDGQRVYSPAAAYAAHSDAIFVICSEVYAYEMYRQLSAQGVPQYNIYIPTSRLFRGDRERQYFDVFRPERGEIFIDAGCFDGNSSLQFIDWCGGTYGSIVCFEADPERAEICAENFQKRGIENIEIVRAICWDNEGEQFFSGKEGKSAKGEASVVSGKEAENALRLKADTIDHVCKKGATFIKMDIEGSELRALHGAQETIRRYHPKLAISIYHKPRDIVEIPSYIMGLYPDYKLTLRHYTSLDCETILYAQ